MTCLVFKAYRDRLPGGKADKKKPNDFDARAVKRGTKVEMEHTDDPKIAREIALDHLTEDPDYYAKLAKMEGRKSLLTEDETRHRVYQHITHIRNGKGVRSKAHHKAKEVYSLEAWRRDVCDKLLEFAEHHLEPNQDVSTWLEARGLELPDQHDATTPKTVGLWLASYGPIAFALGIQLVDVTGRTIVSLNELSDTLKALLHDLNKARVLGTTNISSMKGRPYTGRYGAIRLEGAAGTAYPDGIRRLKAQDVGKEAKIVAYYTNHPTNPIPAIYLPPTEPGGTGYRTTIRKQGDKTIRAKTPHTLTRADLEKLWERWDTEQSTQAHAKRLAETVEHYREPAPPVALPSQVYRELDAQHKSPTVQLIEVLRERVATWKMPTSYAHMVDPIDRHEYAKLKKQRQTMLRAYRKRTSTKGKIASTALGATYQAVERRIKQLEGKAVATEGGGYRALEGMPVKASGKQIDVARISDLPYTDLGFDAITKPMSYLLSLGWHVRDGDLNHFATSEKDALAYEYEGYVRRVSHQIATVLLPTPSTKEERDNVKEWGQELAQRARLLVWKLARTYRPKTEPSPAHNFALYVHSTLPLEIRKQAIALLKKQGLEVPYTEELKTTALGSGGTHLIPKTRPEDPYEATHRKQLHKLVSRIFKRALNPLEWLVLSHYLNIYNYDDPNVRLTGGTLPGQPVRSEEPVKFSSRPTREMSSTGEAVTVETGGLKTWPSVKAGVEATLGDIITDPKQLREAKKWVKNLDVNKNNQLKKIAFNALERLRHYFLKDSLLDNQERRALYEFAAAERLFMEGIRHRTWSPGEMVPVVKVGKLPKMAEKTARVPIMSARDKGAVKFWASQHDLASRLRVDLDFAQYRITPETELPTRLDQQRQRALIYFRAVQKLQKQSRAELKKLRTSMERGTFVPPKAIGRTPSRIPFEHWRTMVDFALLDKAPKRMTKSVVLFDLGACFNEWYDELCAWELTRG